MGETDPVVDGATDPDIDLRVPAQRQELRRAPARLLAVIAAGGSAGASLRYAAALLWPTPAGTFPWTTLGVNVVGCAAIGVLMVLITVGRGVHPLARPFLGVGLLGGFTTFSTYAVDARGLAAAGRAPLALAYLALTVLGALAGVSAAVTVTRRITARHRRGSGEAPVRHR
ncbi:CrcB protein [Frankia sp. EI5c]|uniref:fluoride efflux transporter FluC n=1 Tax=Frankia sp. EI5c TaxID=683316 RepID=UPI0007C23ABF|nr:CrcB family protein [Frankia sp. EI5c]OAA23390.1 CrcB protein [Frankia sp. EI5c]